jgi:type IV secretion system protein VirB10
MTVSPPTSPPCEAEPSDILPLVGEDRGNRPLWIALGLIGLVGISLFAALESRRSAVTAPAVRPKVADVATAQSGVPDLYVPQEPILLRSYPQFVPPRPLPRAQPLAPTPAPPPRATIAKAPLPPVSDPRPFPQQPLSPTAPANTGPAVVYDGGLAPSDLNGTPGQSASAPSRISALPPRAQAARTGDQSSIVPQGTLIAAVLETALDSTQLGQARALVSIDVTNAQGSKVLIPKGSRLFGESRGELGAGQNRAQVQWLRLVRPDGVTIPLDSPAADALGRSGIKGQVNNFFLERLGGALLQSTIDVGALLASRSISGSSVVVALPSNIQGAASQLVPAAPKPRLRIKQGMRIAVFVSRDLDFSAVEGR